MILRDYSRLLGTLVFADDDIMLFQLPESLDPSQIPTEDVRYVGVYVPPRGRRTAGDTPLGLTDMTYERTALPYHGKAQVKTIMLAYSVVEWNLDKHFQVGVGIGGFVGPLFTARYRTTVARNVHVGLSGRILPALLVGGFNTGTPVLGDFGGLATFGNEQRFLNLGTGVMFNTDAFDETSAWANRFGIGAAVSSRWHVYSELLFTQGGDEFFSDFNVFPSVNATFSTRGSRWRFGMFTNFLDEDILFVPPLPYVAYSYHW